MSETRGRRSETEPLECGPDAALHLLPLPPCGCIDMGNNTYITNNCPLHCPVLGLLVEQPVQFTGLLSALGVATDEDHG